MVYYVEGKDIIPNENSYISYSTHTKIKLIMFFSCLLTSTESRYWPTEIELTSLIQVIQKTQHLIKSTAVASIVIFTNHGTNINIFKQIFLESILVKCLNFCIVRTSQYIQRFNLLIQHKLGTSNIIPDTLLWLLQTNNSELDTFNTNVSNSDIDKGYRDLDASAYNYTTTIIKLSKNFKKKIIDSYEADKSQYHTLKTL